MYLDAEALRRRMSNLSDDELLSIVTTHRAEYHQVAINLASEALTQRNIPLPVINDPQLKAAPQPGRSLMRDWMKSKPGRVLATVYLLLAGGALFLVITFTGDLGTFGLAAIWLLTLPWSSVLILFAWALIHNAESPIFILDVIRNNF